MVTKVDTGSAAVYNLPEPVGQPEVVKVGDVGMVVVVLVFVILPSDWFHKAEQTFEVIKEDLLVVED